MSPHLSLEAQMQQQLSYVLSFLSSKTEELAAAVLFGQIFHAQTIFKWLV